jgi:DNA (cytosine-5)-methyltransferase 1
MESGKGAGMTRALRYMTVCSGIEAPSQAWHRLGWQPVSFSEIEPFPCAVLAHRFGASRPWHMPQPEDVPTHDQDGQPRPAAKVAKERAARASAIKAVSHLPVQGEVPNYGDMTRFQEWPDDPAVDVLAGGTPCQSFSLAGLRKGLADPRGNLMLTYGHIAARYRPTWLAWENVYGVLSSADGSDFGSLLGLLTGRAVTPPEGGWQNSGIIPGIADAYGIAWRVFDAQYHRTCGFPRAVPQRRRRVVVIGYLGDWRRAAAVLFDRESLSGHPAPRRQAGQTVAPTIASRTQGGGGLGTDFDCDGGLIANSGDASYRLTASAQNSLDAETETLISVAHTLRGEGHDASEDGTGKGVPLVPIAIQERAVSENPNAGPDGAGFSDEGCAYTLEARSSVQAIAFDPTQITSPANGSNPRPGDACHTLARGQQPPAIAFTAQDHGADAKEEVAPTLRAGGHSDSHRNAGVMPAVATGWAVRRLMPVECERLMGMADGFTDIPWRGKPHAPDGLRYKALGNSWATTLAEWLGERIAEVDSWGRA